MDTQIRSNQSGAIRVSDAERDQAVAELSEHYQAGTASTLEEFADRSGVALRARTGSDLVGLFADLPTTVVPAAMTSACALAVAGRACRSPPPTSAGGARADQTPVARVVIACVIAAIVLWQKRGCMASGTSASTASAGSCPSLSSAWSACGCAATGNPTPN